MVVSPSDTDRARRSRCTLRIHLVPTKLECGPHGSLRGVNILSADGHVKARRFLQIPYAEPPIGELRWRPPRALADDYDWEGVKGEVFGNVTAQPTYTISNEQGDVFPSSLPGRKVSEDALTVNVWTPAGSPPEAGWPVWIYLHGGWLQIGNPAMTDKNNPTELLDETDVKAVVVAAAYRLSVFGFLASKEIQAENSDGTAGNFGFLDQRLAIEWVVKNVHYFGGNGDNITVAGPSAGAYSTQFQLAHELNFPVTAHIKRVMMWSNSIPAQPKSVAECQASFDALLEAFAIPLDVSADEKMARLRAISTEQLQDKIMSLKIHTFRAVTDGAFVHPDTHERIITGDFARKFKTRNLAIIIGEVEAEEHLYGATNPPKTVAELEVQLNNYYRSDQVSKLMSLYDVPPSLDPSTPDGTRDLRALYGTMVAHGQVYVPSRVFVKSLIDHGVDISRVLRYRISWKPAATVRTSLFPQFVTHADDTWAWWYSRRFGWDDQDVQVNKAWLAPVGAFLAGDIDRAAQLWWGGEIPTDPRKQRQVKDGEIRVIEDDRWDKCLAIAAAVEV